MKTESFLPCGGPYYLPILLSHSCSIEAWNKPGEVADEKLTLLNNFYPFSSNEFPHIKTDEVLAVPEPPTSKTAFCWKAVVEYVGLGCSNIELTNKSVLHESTVGSSSWENFKPF